jgi:formate hydrogenlyase transcriptional activator
MSAVEYFIEEDHSPVATEDHAFEGPRKNQQLARLMLIRNFIEHVGRVEFGELLQTTLIELCPIVRSVAAYVFVADCDRRLQLQALAVSDDASGMKQENRTIFQTMVAQRVFETGRPWIGHTNDLEELIVIGDTSAQWEPHTTCGIPIRSGGSIDGVLAVLHNDPTFLTITEVDFLNRLARQIGVAIANTALHRENRHLTWQMTAETMQVAVEETKHSHFQELVGNSQALRRVLSEVEIVAPTGSTVLIQGETGTGKELIARAIHNLSPRRQKNFVKLNCAAIPTGLLESELFGHERGAFTGALTQRLGRFEVANGATIFLDEVGEIPLELQTKLLRVLQEREFERLGSARTIRVNTRLIAATNRDLSAMVAERKFRSDLFYRLNVYPIRVPPLRERAEDIPLLVRHFVSRCNQKMDRAIDTILPETMSALTAYSWPGNIRELENLIERAVIRTCGNQLDLPLRQLQNRPVPSPTKSKARNLQETERAHILAALKETNWVIAGASGAAALLGVHRSTLQHRMEKLGIIKPGK